MKAELKRMHSPDIDNLEDFQPKNPDNFAFLLQIMVGPEGEDSMESFDVEVCTPEWINDTYSYEDIIIGRHHLIVKQYDYHGIFRVIESFVKGCTGSNWDEVANKIGRLGRWEFEDYIG
uniref:Immunity protein 8 n=1 Tax=Candidatus Kentrum sp. DK TaxID=2126562 RepID=A0A450TE52_9GAMM|nr:MAG: Immunity protein 8 [Candidatus Kentron sp. DK]